MKAAGRQIAEGVEVAAALEMYAYEYEKNVKTAYFLRERDRVVKLVLSYLNEGSRVLDVNCGTGIDSVELAAHGHEVTAIDISSTMIEIASQNILASGVSHLAHAEVGDYRKLTTPDVPFDAALSNFGGINFCGDLSLFFDSISRSLSIGGVLVINSVSHFSLSEFIIFLAKGKPGKAFRRLSGATARIGGKDVRLYYHTTRAFVNAGKKSGFDLERTLGLCMFSPPLWADDFYNRHKQLARLLETIDEKIRFAPLLRAAGDFQVFVFRRNR